MTSTPTLLTLPRELRDKLLSLLIACHTDAPKEADDPENREVLNDIDVSDWHYGHAMHVKRLNRVDLIPTLLVRNPFCYSRGLVTRLFEDVFLFSDSILALHSSENALIRSPRSIVS